jgi:2-dehydropantoate 2-reductase
MRYIIIGAGAVGTSLAAQFEEAGIDYILIGRGAQLSHLQREGLLYQRIAGTRHIRLKLGDLAGLRLRRQDVILLTVKTQDVETASRALADLPVEGGLSATDLAIVALQNGLASETILARRFGNIYGASVRTPAIYTEIGRVRVLARPYFAIYAIGRFPAGRDAISARLVADLDRAGALSQDVADIQSWKAQKLLHNVKNAIELFSGPQRLRDLAETEVVAEAERVLKAEGYHYPQAKDQVSNQVEWEVQKHPEEPAGQSTWQSFARGASSEVDYLNGEIVLLGLQQGLATPWNRAVQRLAAELSAEGGKPGDLGLDRLVSLAQEQSLDSRASLG